MFNVSLARDPFDTPFPLRSSVFLLLSLFLRSFHCYIERRPSLPSVLHDLAIVSIIRAIRNTVSVDSNFQTINHILLSLSRIYVYIENKYNIYLCTKVNCFAISNWFEGNSQKKFFKRKKKRSNRLSKWDSLDVQYFRASELFSRN